MRPDIAILAPAPNPHDADLFRSIADRAGCSLTVYFCSDVTLRGLDLRTRYHAADASWGVDLLAGYESRLLTNWLPGGTPYRSPSGLLNPGVIRALGGHDVVILRAWNDLTWWLAILTCAARRTPFLFLGDSSYTSEFGRVGTLKSVCKRWLLGRGLFRLADGFICTGLANRDFYRLYGVPPRKLLPGGNTVDIEALSARAQELAGQKEEVRLSLGLEPHSPVVLFCGCLEARKAPEVLLRAYEKVRDPESQLVFVGDGPERPRLEAYCARKGLRKVTFAGFQNRSAVARYYAAADVVVLPSRHEQWGLVVNEAMAFGLPVIVSERVGCHRNLVRHGHNGFVFPEEDIGALVGFLRFLLSSPPARRRFGKRGRRLIAELTLDRTADRVLAACITVLRTSSEDDAPLNVDLRCSGTSRSAGISA